MKTSRYNQKSIHVGSKTSQIKVMTMNYFFKWLAVALLQVYAFQISFIKFIAFGREINKG